MTNDLFSHRRQSKTISSTSLVEVTPLADISRKGVILRPTIGNLSAPEWAQNSRDYLDQLLEQHGAVLLRDFKVANVDAFRDFAKISSGTLLGYVNRSTPRTIISEGIYSSTDYPADQSIPQHNEMSYTRSWPKRLFFHCAVRPGAQGQTPLADSLKVYARLPEKLRERFEEHGVMYIRNFGHGLDLSWQQVFQTEDRKEVGDYCIRNNIECEWHGEGYLRTRQICQATITHSVTGEGIWFNQAHLFHVSSLPIETQYELRQLFDEHELPRNALFGNGTSIPLEDLNLIRQAYQQEEILFDWEEGDILILSNETISHGRRPFEYPRSIMVAMT